MIGIGEELAPLLERLAAFQPKLVFNGCEAFRGHARHEYAIAAVLDLHGYRYTGSSPTALLVARNKSLTKKILAYHDIRVPAFAEFHEGDDLVRPSELRFPLIVKPLLEDASVGIAQASVVEDDSSLAQRVEFIHQKHHQAAIVEELVDGRELYVGLIGNDDVEVLPLIEMTFGEPETGEHRIATYKAKWDEEYRKRKNIKNVFAKGVSAELTARIEAICSTAFHALWLQDYGRIDVRLTHDDEVYVLEVNPNPFIADEHEMANAAEKAGLKYNAFIQRIVDEAMAR
jgi:D-alanine-D-alanine ligase